MFDYESRHIIEALRSGIPSKSVGQYFAESRPDAINNIVNKLDEAANKGNPKGYVFCGKYGEGKTHLLNTTFNIATKKNMVVSLVSLSKETPFDKLYQIYKKVIDNTFLPGREQAGIMQLFDKLSPNDSIAKDLLLFANTELETDRLFYLLQSYLNTNSFDEKFWLQTDLEGDFVPNSKVKKIYKRIFNEKVTFKTNFVKSKNYMDYFHFLSKLFKLSGYNGWVILFDEVELTGRLGKKARLKSYLNISKFLFPNKIFDSTCTLFALSASYSEDVIVGKKEYENNEDIYREIPEVKKNIENTLDAFSDADQLNPLTKAEIREVLKKVVSFHGQAYGWTPQVDFENLLRTTESMGYLLRTKIRVTIEYLDQLYQYGNIGIISTTELTKENYYTNRLELAPSEIPDLDVLLD